MPSRRAVLTLACLALAVPACARHRVGSGAAIPAEWSLTVTNHHWLDCEIYVVHSGLTTRVGLVTATATETFVLQTYLLGPGGDIRLLAIPIGGAQRVSTGVITISGGQSVEWTLERTLRSSSFSVH